MISMRSCWTTTLESKVNWNQIPITLLAMLYEVKVPLSNSLQICISTSCKCSKKVQSGSRLGVSSDQSMGVWHSGFLVKDITVDIVSLVTWELHPILGLKWIRSGLSKLSSHPSHLWHDQRRREAWFFFFSKLKKKIYYFLLNDIKKKI